VDIDVIFIYISQASVLIPFITGLRYIKYLSKSFTFLLYFFALSVLTEIGVLFMSNNMLLLHIFTGVEFFALGYMYYSFFKGKILFLNEAFVIITISFAFIFVVDLTWFNDSESFNTLSRPYESLMMVALSLLFYYLFIKNELEKVLWEQPMYWLSTGVLIYFSTGIFLFMLSNLLLKGNQDIVDKGYGIHAGVNIICNILYAMSYRCFRKQPIATI
jgi:hypothetical protein